MPRLAKGLLLAPLSALVVFLQMLPVLLDGGISQSTFFTLAFMCVLVLLPFYAATFGVLLPLHLLLQRLGVRALLAYQLLFAALALLLTHLLFPIPQSFYDIGVAPDSSGKIISFLVDVLVATHFWFLVVRLPPPSRQDSHAP